MEKSEKDHQAIQSISKGNSAIHTSAKNHKLYEKIPDHKIKKWIPSKDPVNLSGPYNRQIPSNNFSHAFGVTVSTYPQYYGRKTRDGDPVCDSYRIQVHKNCHIICVADGCGWGERAMQASHRLRDNFIEYFTKIKSVKTLREIAEHLVTSMAYANYFISYDKKDIWMAGTTTGLCGLLVELETTKNPNLPPWAFVFVSIGDCKCFHYIASKQTCEDITVGNRMNITDARDPGGRLGPHHKNGDPDLRNLDLYWVGCNEGDIIIVVSDGVHDNLDPQCLGFSPNQFELEHDNWDDVDIKDCMNIKSKFMNEYITKIILGDNEDDIGLSPSSPMNNKRILSPPLACKRLIRHCQDTTKKSREWMEQNPQGVLEPDYTKYPGKLDHTTVVAVTVGNYDPLNEKPTQIQSLRPEVWPF